MFSVLGLITYLDDNWSFGQVIKISKFNTRHVGYLLGFNN